MADRVPPRDDVAERAVLGCVLLDQRTLPRMRRLIDAGHFCHPARGVVWGAMCALADAGAQIDVVLLRAYLERTRTWDQVGLEGIQGLTDAVGTSTNAEAYAGRVRDLAALRGVIGAAQTIADAGYALRADPRAIMAEARAAMTRATVIDDGGDRPEAAAEGVPRAYEEATAPPESRRAQLDCGICGLRIRRGVPTVLGGRTSNGKSTAALNCAANMSTQGHRGLVFSLEDTREAYWSTLACRFGDVNTERAALGTLEGGEYTKMMAGANRAAALPLHVVDRAGVSAEWVYQTAALHQQDHPDLAYVVVDYVQLLRERGRDETERTTNAMRGLVTLARDLDVGLIVLSQVGRPPKDRVPGPPTIHDLRQSGEIEQAADTVVLIHWEYLYTRIPEDREKLRWDQAKRKRGRVGVFDAECTYETAYVGTRGARAANAAGRQYDEEGY